MATNLAGGLLVVAVVGPLIILPVFGVVLGAVAATISVALDWITGTRVPRRLIAAAAIIIVALMVAVVTTRLAEPGAAHERWMLTFIGSPALYSLAALIIPLPPRPESSRSPSPSSPWSRSPSSRSRRPRGWLFVVTTRLPYLAAAYAVPGVLVFELSQFVQSAVVQSAVVQSAVVQSAVVQSLVVQGDVVELDSPPACSARAGWCSGLRRSRSPLDPCRTGS